MTLTETLAHIKALPEPTREGSDRVLIALGWTHRQLSPTSPEFLIDPAGKKWAYKISKDFRVSTIPHVLADLQAAIDHVVKGKRFQLGVDAQGTPFAEVDGRCYCEGKQPAHALCIASLEALAAKGETA